MLSVTMRSKIELRLFVGSILISLLMLAWLQSVPLVFPDFPALTGDSAEYFAIGKNMLEYGVYSLTPDGFSESFRSPGYPAVVYVGLAIFGSAVGISLIQIIMTFGTSTRTCRGTKQIPSIQDREWHYCS